MIQLPRWRATQRVMQSAVVTSRAVLSAEARARLSSDFGWLSHYQRWAHDVLRSYGITPVLHGALPQCSPSRGALLLCPHRSPLDVAVLVSLMPELRFLSRADVAHWPFIGTAAKRARTLFVERGDRRSAMKAVEQMRTALAQGDALAVFPEGTTKATTQIGPLRSGAFRACAGLAVDIWGVAMTFPDGFGWGRQGRGLVNHLRDVAAHAPLQVDVCFQKFEALPSGYAQAARFCREKLQDLDTLLRTQRER